MWEHNDDCMDYTEEIKQSFWSTLSDYIAESATNGGEIGERILGVPGKLVGHLIGGLFGIGKGIYHRIVD